MHVGCNSQRGNRTRRLALAHSPSAAQSESNRELEPEREARDVAYKKFQKPIDEKIAATNLALFVDDDFLRDAATRRPSPANISPKSPGNSESVELVPARIETPRPADVTGSYGPEARGWIREYLDAELRPWQAYALDRILEHRDDGSLRWRRVIVTVSRQSGKSVLARGLCGWRVGAADLFGEPQLVLHVANLRSTAGMIWTEAARKLEASIGARIRRANGQEAIELADGSAWRLAASTLDGGVGWSVSLGFVDEAWRISREVVDGSIAPTMLERASPQLVLVSTAGDGGSTLLAEDRAAAIEQIADPDSARILILEWSAPPEADIGDREAWRLASPHWSRGRVEALEHAFETTPENSWRIQYLNQWVRSARSWITATQWKAGERTELAIPRTPAGTVAIESHVSGFPYGAVHAVADDAGEVYVTARVYRSRRELWQWLDELALERRGLTLLHSPAFVGHIPGSLRGVRSIKVGMAEQYAAFGPTLAAATEARILHLADAELSAQVLSAATISVPDRGTALSSKESAGPIFLARSLVWAVGHELRPESRRRPRIVSTG